MKLRNFYVLLVVVLLGGSGLCWCEASFAQPAGATIAGPAAETPQLTPAELSAQPPTPTPNLPAASTPTTEVPSGLAPPVTPSLPPAPRTTPVSSSRSRDNNSAFSPRLARAAPIMGDTVSPSLVFRDELGSGNRQLPQGGGATRAKIAENSSSLPMDRFIFNYNHFHNAINENLQYASNIDRFTVGLEKTFLDQMASIEVRFPFVVDNDFSIPGDFTRNGSEVGNLSVTLKGVLTSDSDSLIAAGLTIDTPTGGGSVLTNEGFTDPLIVDISNDAVHLAPFVGFLAATGSAHTHQGFIQLDVATNPNIIEFSDSSGTTSSELLEQTLLYLDYQFATELYHAGRRSQNSCDVYRILGLAELHYTTTLEDSDYVVSGTASNPLFEVTSYGNRLDVVNLTLGLHTEFSSGTQLRLGTVAPLTEDDDRFFDFEFQAQLNVPLY